MKVAILQFPGSNCDWDAEHAVQDVLNVPAKRIWHKSGLPAETEAVIVPGGFSFGDYLRCGAIAAQSPICRAVVDHANRGGYVLGVCNGFQVLSETGLVPGALMRNSGLKFLCKTVGLTVETQDSAFTAAYSQGSEIQEPIAHHDGNYISEPWL